MVLDDLGLGPTIRRIASDRGRRTGINVEFDSQGIEDRLEPDIESAVYRSIDEAITGYLALKPPSVLVRLDWGERELVATVEGTWPRINAEGQAESSEAAAARSVETPPALLAMMEEKRSADREADRASRALPPRRGRRDRQPCRRPGHVADDARRGPGHGAGRAGLPLGRRTSAGAVRSAPGLRCPPRSAGR